MPGEGSIGLPGLQVMSEAELASLRRDEGSRVVEHGDRFWEQTFPGFYQPVNPLAPLRRDEIRRPTPFCWGYRARVGSLSEARSSIPAHLLSLAGGFDESGMVRNRRTDLRKCRERVEFIRLEASAGLLEQAYQVFDSAMRRVAYWRPRRRADYLERMSRSTGDDRSFFIAGLVKDRLGGYMETFAVDGVLYLKDLIVATDALATGMSTGLYLEAIRAGQRCQRVHTVCSGFHAPENEGLCHFKRGLGFEVVQVPAISDIPKPVAAFIRARRPAVYYRLTGDASVIPG